MTEALTQINKARQALAEAKNIHDVLSVRDAAMATAVYAEARGAGEAADEAKEIQLRAEWKAGKFLKESPKATGGEHGGKSRIDGSRLEPSNPTPTYDDIGIPKTTAYRWQKVSDIPEEKLNEHIAEKRASGKELTATGMLQLATRLKEPEPTETPSLPTDKYSCIVIDPPWPVKKIERFERPNQGVALDYPIMTVEDIEALPIGDVARDKCHLYLWVTQKYLPDGLRMIESWGFKYQCLMTWVKPTGITPYSWMYNTEHVIYAHRGGLKLERMGLKLAFEAKQRGHSTKPDVFYERVLQASPEPRLEMFARSERDGFEVWGNEV